jgi:hypothetical protein
MAGAGMKRRLDTTLTVLSLIVATLAALWSVHVDY